MRMPTNYTAQQDLLTADMKAEQKYLSANAPTFGRVAPEDYAQRAAAFNAECKKIGATFMMVVEG